MLLLINSISAESTLESRKWRAAVHMSIPSARKRQATDGAVRSSAPVGPHSRRAPSYEARQCRTAATPAARARHDGSCSSTKFSSGRSACSQGGQEPGGQANNSMLPTSI
eukprot:3371420-Prymnesium_polylepis.2